MTDNRKYVRRRQELIIRADPGWKKEIELANHKKNGAPYQYADSLFAALATVKAALDMPYRNLQGMAIEILGEENTPDYSTIYKRIQELHVDIGNRLITVTGKDDGRFAFAALYGNKAAQQGRVDTQKVEDATGVCKDARSGRCQDQGDHCHQGYRRISVRRANAAGALG